MNLKVLKNFRHEKRGSPTADFDREVFADFVEAVLQAGKRGQIGGSASGGPILFGRVGPLAHGRIDGEIRNRGVGFRGLLLFARSADGFFRHGFS